MREECLVDLEQRALIVDEEVEDVGFVLAREVTDFDSILCQLGKPMESLLELFCLFGALVELLELLAIVNLIL